MIYLYLYYLLIVVIGAGAIIAFQKSIFYSRPSSNIRFKRNRIKDFSSNVRSQLNDNELDRIFTGSGINISSFTYNLLRYSFITAWVLIIIINYFINKYFSQIQIFSLIVTLLLTMPKMTVFNHNTPFSIVINGLMFRYKHNKNLEINRALSQLKNLSIISSNADIGSDFIIDELMKLTKLTKPIFATTLKYWRENEKLLAAEYFTNALDTREGKELANIFLKLDNLSPLELKEQISLCQTIFKEERRSSKEKINEYKGYALYGVVIISIFAILLNFVVLILYVNTIDVFNNIKFKF